MHRIARTISFAVIARIFFFVIAGLDPAIHADER
jgi:hypothetical protein